MCPLILEMGSPEAKLKPNHADESVKQDKDGGIALMLVPGIFSTFLIGGCMQRGIALS